MKKQQMFINTALSLLLGFILVLTGCIRMSEKETDKSVGLNGGFEVAKNGLPVNWSMYTPNTVSGADFEIELDNIVFKEGKQSLKFDVSKCSSTGGNKSPGFTNEFIDNGKFEGEGIYKLSFWIKNDGTTFNISSGGVAAKEGSMRTLIEHSEQIDEWRLHEFEIDVPEDRWLRIQLNILEPGTFWIDDIRIERI